MHKEDSQEGREVLELFVSRFQHLNSVVVLVCAIEPVELMPNQRNNHNRRGTRLYVVRHCEREDNVNRYWRREGYKFSDFARDDSPLSDRGIAQAEECASRFSTTQIDYAFSSPYNRCMETTARILGDRWTKIKVEPGFSEILCMCKKPAGFWDLPLLSKVYVNTDLNYRPVYRKWTLDYDYERVRSDSVCLPRVHRTLQRILNDYAGSILIVSHGAVVNSIHKVLIGKWCTVGQATVSKFVQVDSNSFFCEYSGDSSHLTDQTNLRAF